MNSITFTHEMAQAIFEGRKTETRRLCDWQPRNRRLLKKDGKWFVFNASGSQGNRVRPEHQVGDIVAVKEPWQKNPFLSDCHVNYSDDPRDMTERESQNTADEMPEWAVRTRIRITDVRLEWLQDAPDDEEFPPNRYLDGDGDLSNCNDWQNPLVWVYRFEVVK